MTFFDCTADLVGQLNGNGQKEMLQIDAPLSKISGYATGGLIWFFSHGGLLRSVLHRVLKKFRYLQK